jgi:hypothetical protein
VRPSNLFQDSFISPGSIRNLGSPLIVRHLSYNRSIKATGF